MKRISLWGLALVMAVGLCSVTRLTFAQRITASITGTVEDAAGAAIDGATVTARDTERGTSYSRQNQQWRCLQFQQPPYRLL